MKFRLFIVYGVLIVVALIVLVFLTTQEERQEISGNEMPSDDIHRQFQSDNPLGEGDFHSEFYIRLEELRIAVEKNPDDTTVLREYADYLTAAHQFDAALPVYEEILLKNPKRTDVYFALTFIHFNRREWEKAEEANRKILSYDSNNLQAQYNLGAIAASKGDNNKAREFWNKLSKENPDTRQGQLAAEGLKKL
jgi:tetratricopeptide (TPR) repeat protein